MIGKYVPPPGPLLAPLVIYRRGEGDVHRAVKDAVARWLFSCGLRSVGTEVPIMGGSIVVDAVGVGWASPTAQRALGQKGRWRRKLSVVIEVKGNRSDHLRDVTPPALPLLPPPKAGKYDTLERLGFGDLRYVAAPPGVVKPGELPEGWGLLIVDDGAVRKSPSADVKPSGRFDDLALAIGETWTRNALFAALRDAHRSAREATTKGPKRKAKVKAKCGLCMHYSGLRRRSGDKPAFGECSAGHSVYSRQGVPANRLICGGTSFSPVVKKDTVSS